MAKEEKSSKSSVSLSVSTNGSGGGGPTEGIRKSERTAAKATTKYLTCDEIISAFNADNLAVENGSAMETTSSFDGAQQQQQQQVEEDETSQTFQKFKNMKNCTKM